MPTRLTLALVAVALCLGPAAMAQPAPSPAADTAPTTTVAPVIVQGAAKTPPQTV